MPTTRDYDQAMKAALEMKGLAQKFIDFVKPYTSAEVPDDAGEEDLEEVEDDDSQDETFSIPKQGEEEAPPKNKGRVKALALLLKKKMKK